MLDDRLPGPVPSQSDAEFWSACGRHELRLRHCRNCDGWHHPPLPLCPHCQGVDMQWRLVEGSAALYSWTRVHVAMHASVTDALPYYIAIVEFLRSPGARLIAYLDHSGADPPVIASECELFWITATGGQPVPAFRTRPRDGAAPAA